VSVSTDGKQANAASARPAISGNGRFVAFESLASNLVPGDTNDAADIFVHDRLTGETKRVSVGIDGEQANGPSERVTIAHDGRYLAYQSLASNLTRGDDNDTWDIYIYDTGVTGKVIRESVSTEGEGGNGQSYTPAISGDGRIVAFVSEADNLVSGDSNGQPDVFVYHRVLAKTELVSVCSTGVQAESWTASPSLSFSGRNVVFTSPATNLAPGTQGGHNIFLRDRQESITRLLVASSPEIPYLHLAFSDDAKILFYQTPLVEGAGELIWQNIRTGAAQTIWGAVIDPRFDLSGDGQTAVFASSDDPETAFSQVYVWETRPQSPAHFISGQITDPLGTPLALVTLTDPFGNSTRTGIDGRFWLNGYAPGPVTLTAKKEGYSIRYSAFSVQLTEDMTGVDFTATPTDALTEARLDLGMPYNFDRGCDNPFKGCDGPFHGFTAGYCTDLVLDAYTYGLDFNIQFDLEQDANAHPAHFYRWRNARNTHDMWRFFSYTGQMRPHDAPYQPGDIVFFDWTEDGELDHVALVSGVDENGRPTTMLDATGVTGYNPSGLAAELPWEPFHERTVRGHARWSGAYQPVV
ncbi:MAG: DUF1287 domain-containing protein, partial [Anaerolineales bacterium]